MPSGTASRPTTGGRGRRGAAGGFAWSIDDWGRLDRFLVLGSEGGTYYVAERALTLDNAEAVARCVAADGVRVVARVTALSQAGRAPKNDPAIFALAMAAKLGDDATRKAAYAALPAVCRTGTHVMHFAAYAQAFGGWGRGMRNAVARWFNAKPAADLAYRVEHGGADAVVAPTGLHARADDLPRSVLRIGVGENTPSGWVGMAESHKAPAAYLPSAATKAWPTIRCSSTRNRAARLPARA